MKRKFLLTQILYLVVLFEAGFTFSGTHCTYKNWFLTSVIASWEWRHRRMLEISNLEKRSKKGVALKHGQGSTYYDIKWVKAAFSSTLARKALFFFSFPPRCSDMIQICRRLSFFPWQLLSTPRAEWISNDNASEDVSDILCPDPGSHSDN